VVVVVVVPFDLDYEIDGIVSIEWEDPVSAIDNYHHPSIINHWVPEDPVSAIDNYPAGGRVSAIDNCHHPSIINHWVAEDRVSAIGNYHPNINHCRRKYPNMCNNKNFIINNKLNDYNNNSCIHNKINSRNYINNNNQCIHNNNKISSHNNCINQP